MTTGSTVLGLVQGMARGMGAQGPSGLDIGEIVNVLGNPDSIVTGVPASGVAWDGQNGQHYMNLIEGGSTWCKLGSIA